MISRIVDFVKRAKKYHIDVNVPYENKNYYIVMLCAIPVLVMTGLLFVVKGGNIVLSAICFFMALYTLFASMIAGHFSEPVRFSYAFCFTFNFFVVPIIFYLSEGVFYGMVMFFVLGIILTMILLGRQKRVLLVIAIEIIYDALVIFYSFMRSDRVYMDITNLSQEHAMALSFAIVSGTVIFLFGYQNRIHKDISNRIALDNESITKAENTKGRFLANMTHEIRTPMNAIIGMTDIILKEDLSKDAREYADAIKVASGQLLQIINNILEYSKLDSGRAELINNEYSFRAMIEEIISETSAQYVRDDIILYVFVSKDIPDRLFGDVIRIKQVLRYLLFSPLSRNTNGIVNLECSFNYDEENRIISFNFKISSTGNGLSKEEMSAIHNAYSNYDSRQKTDYNRTGLEFSICERILNMMGGILTIDSIEGIGNSIELTFDNYVVDDEPIIRTGNTKDITPLIYVWDKRSEGAWQRLIEEFGLSATYVRTPVSFRSAIEQRNFTVIYIPKNIYSDLKEYIEAFNCEEKVYIIASGSDCYGDFGNCKVLRFPIYLFNFQESISGKYNPEKYKNSMEIEEVRYPYAKVLCVDDTMVNLTVLSNLLKEYDINATLAGSGKEALNLLELNEFDLLIIDQKMPEMDGIELISKIKELSNPNSTTPSICATADFGASIKEELERAGFNDYLAKPINIIYLDRMLKEYLPEELKVVKTLKNKKSKLEQNVQAIPSEENQLDPLDFSPKIGIANLGGNKDAYISVLLAYYREGVQKLEDVPMQLASGDISLYTTNVHALKSSSATVGCMGISPLFKALEFAGKDNNIEFITENSENTFALFTQVLEKVSKYLEDEGALTTEEETDIDFDDVEAVPLDIDLINELSQCIGTMNLRRCEEIIDILMSKNYGREINSKISSIKSNYDNFEYFEIKTIIEELL